MRGALILDPLCRGWLEVWQHARPEHSALLIGCQFIGGMIRIFARD